MNRFDIAETARKWMQRNDVAIPDRGQSDEAEVDQALGYGARERLKGDKRIGSNRATN